ncbi:MAG: DUF4268 domain-containing protein [Polyangiaceae bacterium]|nr:DUF4268 domain-containing protein [Polyangiaceae bacterium]
MEAAECKIHRVLEGNKQFLVPHFQRPYSWGPREWDALWRDLLELVEDADSKPHFIGPIVSAPAHSVPEGVEKRLLIDGQQRLTTLVVLLCLIRERALAEGTPRVAERIRDLITNRHDEGSDHFKLLPTQAEDPQESDREALIHLVAGGESAATPTRSGIGAAAEWFGKKLRRSDAPTVDALFWAVTSKLTLVSIILDEKDNPHRIFESLNGKGRPLSQADLIRNYFFMRLPEREHERAYIDVWRPMQRRLGEENLTPFVRHYLTRFVGVVRETDVYGALKARVDGDGGDPLAHLRALARSSVQYEMLLRPDRAPPTLRARLVRLNRLEVTVAYPLLLGVLEDLADGRRSELEVTELLDVLENFVVRRFVCAVPTHGLNKMLAPLYEQASKEGDFVAAVKRSLGGSPRAYPRDDDFRTRLSSARLYGAGERREKTKLLLERLEAASGHKEAVDLATATIEHVMPQTLTDAWKEHLGADWEETHEEYLHTLGNLTLTAYNPELGNSPYPEKQKRFASSHIDLNRYFEAVGRWDADAIESRAEALAGLALATWPYFGPRAEPDADETSGVDATAVTGTVPVRVRILEKDRPVVSWVDVALVTMNAIAAIGDEEFRRCVDELPKFVNTDATAFRKSSRLKKLDNGAYLETNLSASGIYRLCLQATELAELGPEDWAVTYRTVDPEGTPPAASDVRQLQADFWTAVRAALLATGAFPSLRAPRPQYWFNIAIGRTGLWLSLVANTQEGHVGVQLVLGAERAEQALVGLAPDRAAIEHEIGAPLLWNPHPEKQQRVLKLIHPCRLVDRTAWPAAIAWLTEYAPAFYRAFAPRVQKLELG